MVLTFHDSMFKVVLVEMMVFGPVTSRCISLSLLGVILPPAEGSSFPRTVNSFDALVHVSVT